jgi:hypothetical protein
LVVAGRRARKPRLGFGQPRARLVCCSQSV